MALADPDTVNEVLYYKFTRLDDNQSVVVKRDEAPPTIVGAGARWTVVNRPRRGSFTTYDGTDLYKMDVPVLFDGWDRQESIEGAVSILNQMSFPGSLDYGTPPQVLIDGMVPVKNATWILDPQISWGSNVIWHPSGYRLRQDAVIHLLEFRAADQLKVKPALTSIIYTVKKGDTLKSISKNRYGTTIYWTVIQSVNGIRDHKTIKVGQKLRLPEIIGK